MGTLYLYFGVLRHAFGVRHAVSGAFKFAIRALSKLLLSPLDREAGRGFLPFFPPFGAWTGREGGRQAGRQGERERERGREREKEREREEGRKEGRERGIGKHHPLAPPLGGRK